LVSIPFFSGEASRVTITALVEVPRNQKGEEEELLMDYEEKYHIF